MSEKEENGIHIYVDAMQSVEKAVVYKIHDSNDSIPTSGGSSRVKYTSCLCLMISISLILAIAALVFAGAIVAIDQKALSESQQEVETLMKQIDMLESRLNSSHSSTQTNTIHEASLLQQRINQLSEMQNSLQATIDNHTGEFNQIITTQRMEFSNQIDEVQDDLLEKLQGNVTEVNHQLDDVQQEIVLANGQLFKINSNVTSLNDLLTSEVNLYEECVTDVQLCSIEPVPETSRFYWRVCGTPWANLTRKTETGYYVVDTHCTYESNYGSGHLVSSVLHEDRDRVRCRCSIARPSHTESTYQILQPNLDSVCRLEIVRCPLSQLLY